MKEFTYVCSLRELSRYTFITSSEVNFYFDYQNEEKFSILNDGKIKVFIKSTLLPIKFYKLGKINKLIIETPVRDFYTGLDMILVKEILDVTANIEYQINCSGNNAVMDLSLTGKIDKEYLKKEKKDYEIFN